MPSNRRYPLGVHSVVFGRIDVRTCFEQAAALGFDHVDIGDVALQRLHADGGPPAPLPAGDLLAGRGFAPDRTAMAPVLRPNQSYDEVVALLRSHPGTRLEVGPGSVAGSVEGIRRLADDVPGLRYTIDTGHIAGMGRGSPRGPRPGRPRATPPGGPRSPAAVAGRG